jgi:hypothetical protein
MSRSIRVKRQRKVPALGLSQSSDVVEGGLFGLEVAVWLGWLLAFPTSLSNQGSESVSVPDC